MAVFPNSIHCNDNPHDLQVSARKAVKKKAEDDSSNVVNRHGGYSDDGIGITRTGSDEEDVPTYKYLVAPPENMFVKVSSCCSTATQGLHALPIDAHAEHRLPMLDCSLPCKAHNIVAYLQCLHHSCAPGTAF